MKKIFICLLTLLMSQGVTGFLQAASVTEPDPSKEYVIKHYSGLYLGRVADQTAPKITAATTDYDQNFQFEPVPDEAGTYYIKNLDANEYLVRANVPKADGTGQDTWSMIWLTDLSAATTAADAKYTITANGDYVYIKNSGSNGNLGVDSAEPNSSVYGNKGEGNNNSWTIQEFVPGVDKEALIAKLLEANSIYDATQEGTASDQYPAATRTALKTAIDAGQAIVDRADAWQTEVNLALSDLIAALQAYVDSVYPLRPLTTEPYYLEHSSGLFFDSTVKITAGKYTADQQYSFVATSDPDVFNIKSSAGTYLTRSDNGWDLVWGEDPAIDLAQFIIKKVASSSGFYTIRVIGLSGGKTAEWSFAGTDNNNENATIYADKSGKDGKHYWKVGKVSDYGVVKTGLASAIAAADEFLQYAVKGSGPDQYPATEYDALTGALAVANTVNDNSTATQEQVSVATTALNEALTAAKASVIPFAPEAGKNYNIIHSSGLYLGEFSDDTNTNTVAVLDGPETINRLFTFVPAAGGALNIKVASLPDKYLTRASEVSGDGYNDWLLTWGEDPTIDLAQFEIKKSGTQNYYTVKCLGVVSGSTRTNSYLGTDANPVAKNGAFIDKDGTSTNHFWTLSVSNLSSIKTIASNKLTVYSADNQLTVKDLAGNSRISIYSTTGQLISRTNVAGSSFTKELSTGNYIVVVDGKIPFRGIVAVR
jgi:hypothetical protein